MDYASWKKVVKDLLEIIEKAPSHKQKLDYISKLRYYIDLLYNDVLFKGGK